MISNKIPTLAKANSIVPFLLNESKHISIHCLSIFQRLIPKAFGTCGNSYFINGDETKDELPPRFIWGLKEKCNKIDFSQIVYWTAIFIM
jgi:hypothetical protein